MKGLYMGIFHRRLYSLAVVFFLLSCAATSPTAETDPLSSWNEGPSKRAIVEFVQAVSDKDGPDYIEPSARIAVFDNDGTLWAEKPVYFQFFFILDRIRVMAPDYPEWKTTQPFQSVLENDWDTLKAASRDDLARMMTYAVSGMTEGAFESMVAEWMKTARHPETGRPFTSMVYQPMLELLDYLQANGFTTFIVSGGGISFMRPWAEEVYGIPPERVVGTSMELEYEVIDGVPAMHRKPELHFYNDKAGKPIGIQRYIGKRPILAGGNSDGDYEMLEWTTTGAGRRLGLIIHHTDAEREWAYDRHSAVGGLNRGLDDAKSNDWHLVDMARDWRVIFPAP
jgi:phosphoserine phosphatase